MPYGESGENLNVHIEESSSVSIFVLFFVDPFEFRFLHLLHFDRSVQIEEDGSLIVSGEDPFE